MLSYPRLWLKHEGLLPTPGAPASRMQSYGGLLHRPCHANNHMRNTPNAPFRQKYAQPLLQTPVAKLPGRRDLLPIPKHKPFTRRLVYINPKENTNFQKYMTESSTAADERIIINQEKLNDNLDNDMEEAYRLHREKLSKSALDRKLDINCDISQSIDIIEKEKTDDVQIEDPAQDLTHLANFLLHMKDQMNDNESVAEVNDHKTENSTTMGLGVFDSLNKMLEEDLSSGNPSPCVTSQNNDSETVSKDKPLSTRKKHKMLLSAYASPHHSANCKTEEDPSNKKRKSLPEVMDKDLFLHITNTEIEYQPLEKSSEFKDDVSAKIVCDFTSDATIFPKSDFSYSNYESDRVSKYHSSHSRFVQKDNDDENSNKLLITTLFGGNTTEKVVSMSSPTEISSNGSIEGQGWFCCICKKLTFDLRRLHEHKVNKAQTKSHCAVCNKWFDQEKHLVQHCKSLGHKENCAKKNLPVVPGKDVTNKKISCISEAGSTKHERKKEEDSTLEQSSAETITKPKRVQDQKCIIPISGFYCDVCCDFFFDEASTLEHCEAVSHQMRVNDVSNVEEVIPTYSSCNVNEEKQNQRPLQSKITKKKRYKKGIVLENSTFETPRNLSFDDNLSPSATKKLNSTRKRMKSDSCDRTSDKKTFDWNFVIPKRK